MRRRFDQRVLSVVGLLVACHSDPIMDPQMPPPADEPISGAAGADSSSPESGSSSGGNESGGHVAQAGGGATQNSGGNTPADPHPALGGAAGEPAVEPEAGAGNGPPVYGPFDGPARCTSGRVRDPNESEGAEMNPGFPCIFCHTVSNSGSGEADAPIFAFAGTLYSSAHEPDSCIGGGQDSAEVVVKDSTGVERSALANSSGNFAFEDAVLSPPFSVKVVFEGRERAATTPHEQPDCNRCHTPLGDQGAPGRVVLP